MVRRSSHRFYLIRFSQNGRIQWGYWRSDKRVADAIEDCEKYFGQNLVAFEPGSRSKTKTNYPVFPEQDNYPGFPEQGN